MAEYENGKSPFEHSSEKEAHQDVDMRNLTDRKQSIVLHEAADLYGDRETAESEFDCRHMIHNLDVTDRF